MTLIIKKKRIQYINSCTFKSNLKNGPFTVFAIMKTKEKINKNFSKPDFPNPSFYTLCSKYGFSRKPAKML